MIAHPECEHLRSPGYANFGLSIFILCAILLSYLPQHHRIVRRRSSDGLSPYFVLLGSTASTCAFANILLLPRSTADARCCRVVSRLECVASVLGIAQVGMQWLCFSIIVFLFLIYFPRGNTPEDTVYHDDDPNDINNTNNTTTTATTAATVTKPPQAPEQYRHSYRTAVLVTFAYAAHLLVTAIVGAALLLIRPRDPRDDDDNNNGGSGSNTSTAIGAYATALGVAAAALTVLQYFPQLHTTWRCKAAGSLSIPMMLIQTPGAFVWAGSLAARLGWAGWSAWGMFVVSGCLQGVLLAMTVTYELRARRLRLLQEQQERWRQQQVMGAGEDDEEGEQGAGGVGAYCDEGAGEHGDERGSR